MAVTRRQLARSTHSGENGEIPQQHVPDGSAVPEEEPEENELPSSEDEDIQLATDKEEDEKMRFYNRSRHPRQRICPFSNSTRANPCTTHANPRKRKDAIMLHLFKIKGKGGDEQHPLKDPLWNSWEVKFYLHSRPPKFDENKKKKSSRVAARRYYQKRKHIQDTKAELKKADYESGAIPPLKYASYLVGHRKRKFLNELQIQKALHDKVEEEVARRLEELRGSEGNDEDIAALEQAQRELQRTQAESGEYSHMLEDSLHEIIRLFVPNDAEQFLNSDSSFMGFRRYLLPRKPSHRAFYSYAALLILISQWESTEEAWSANTVRRMKLELQQYVDKEVAQLDIEEEKRHIREMIAVFGACCDKISAEREAIEEWSTDTSQKWLEDQAQLWQSAKHAFLEKTQADSVCPLKHFSVLDFIADNLRQIKEAKAAQDAAQENANRLLNGTS